jgi:hypothetical protein
MPDVSDTIQQLKAKFLRKGLTEKDLVLLSGIMHAFSLSLSHADQMTLWLVKTKTHDMNKASYSFL